MAPGCAAGNAALTPAPAPHQTPVWERGGVNAAWLLASPPWREGPACRAEGHREPQPSRRSRHNGQRCLRRGSSQAGSSPQRCRGKESRFLQGSRHTSSQDACVQAWRLQVGRSRHVTRQRRDSSKREPSPGLCLHAAGSRGCPSPETLGPTSWHHCPSHRWLGVSFSVQAR